MIKLPVNILTKIAPFATVGLFLLNVTSAFAQGTTQPVQVGAPPIGINPATGIGTILSNALTIAFVAAALLVLFFLVLGAFRWITSGGDKEAVAGARKQIVAALVGLAILALAFLIIVVVGRILNINILDIKNIPSLDKCKIGEKFDPSATDADKQCIPI